VNNVLQITDRAGVGVTVHAKWGLPHLGGAAALSQSPVSQDYKLSLTALPTASLTSNRSITAMRPEGGGMLCRQFCNVKIGDITYPRPATSAQALAAQQTRPASPALLPTISKGATK